MTKYFYVLIEQYVSGTVKAAVLKTRMANQQPVDFYKQEPGREIYGEWVASESKAYAIVAEAKAMNTLLIGRAV